MEYTTLKPEYTSGAKQLWKCAFKEKNPGFCDFLFALFSPEDIYIAVENDVAVAILMAVTELEYGNRKGFYLYCAYVLPEYSSSTLQHLAEYAINSQAGKGRDFCVVQPTEANQSDFWKSLGFTHEVSLRKCNLDIKRNIWQKADFDIVTASRFRQVRERNCEEKTVHYSPKGYERFTAYMYTCGGSTVESEDAYRVYFVENNTLTVKELFAASTLAATHLLQAVRERTGYENATVYLSENSPLFLGEGGKRSAFLIKNLDEDVHVNLMFE